MSFLKTSSGTLDSTSGGTGTVPLGNYLETETKFLCLKVDCNEHFRGLVQTIFGKISVIVTLGGGGGGGCDVKKNFIVRKYCFIIRNI